jgi:hypothetical protein
MQLSPAILFNCSSFLLPVSDEAAKSSYSERMCENWKGNDRGVRHRKRGAAFSRPLSFLLFSPVDATQAF